MSPETLIIGLIFGAPLIAAGAVGLIGLDQNPAAQQVHAFDVHGERR
jgi:hypothetical protein